jgi:hypothetical protein
MTLIPRVTGPIAICLLLACASAAPEHAYIAPTPETVFTTTEEMSASPGQIISVENRSSVPITVYSVILRDCQNVKTQCSSPRRLNLQLAPHSRQTLVRVEPTNPRVSFGYHFGFSWRADPTTTAALAVLASAGDSVARLRLAAIEREDARRRAAVGGQDLDLTTTEINALADHAASLRALPDSLVLPRGARVTLDTIHVLLIGTQGETLGRIRAIQWRLTPGVVSAIKPDTLVAVATGRAVLQLNLPDDVLPGKPALHTGLQVPIIIRQ